MLPVIEAESEGGGGLDGIGMDIPAFNSGNGTGGGDGVGTDGDGRGSGGDILSGLLDHGKVGGYSDGIDNNAGDGGSGEDGAAITTTADANKSKDMSLWTRKRCIKSFFPNLKSSSLPDSSITD